MKVHLRRLPLSESVAAERLGTRYRHRVERGLEGATLAVNLAANAAGLGAPVLHASTREQLARALAGARLADSTTVVVDKTGPLLPPPDSASRWDVRVGEVATRPAALAARERYDAERPRQRSLLSGAAAPAPPGSR